MFSFAKKYYQFFAMLLVWLIAGAINHYVGAVVVALSIILLKRKFKFVELLLGFFFILILSDSINPIFQFSRTVKSIYLVLLFLLFILDSRQFKLPNQFFIPFIPFFIVAVLSLIDSPTLKVSSQKTLSYILLYITIPAYINKCLFDYKEKFLKLIVILITTVLIFGFVLAIIFPTYSLHGSRFMGIFGNPNGIGLFCSIIFILITVIFHYHPSLFTKNEKIFVLGVIIASAVFAMSRNSIFSISIFLLFKQFHKISALWGFIILIAIGLMYQVIAMNFILIVSTLGLESYFRLDTLESGSGRLVAWEFAWKYLQENFIFGKGFAFEEHLFHIYQDSLQKFGHMGGVHNFYLAVWLNTGLIGLVCYLYAFFKTISKVVLFSHLVLPIMYSFLFSLTFEVWLIGSLNPYNIGFIIIFVILIFQKQYGSKTEYRLS